MVLLTTILGQILQLAVFLTAIGTIALFAATTVAMRSIQRRRQP
jgi:hypothetical protein